jgi:hypothetical protein
MPCAGNPRTAAGDTTTESQTTADIRLRSQPAAEPRIYRPDRTPPPDPPDSLTEIEAKYPERRVRLAVVPEHVVHPVLLGGWWLLKPQSQGGPDEVAR